MIAVVLLTLALVRGRHCSPQDFQLPAGPDERRQEICRHCVIWYQSPGVLLQLPYLLSHLSSGETYGA